MRRGYYLDPLGCAKNQVDAETMMAFLQEAGWVSAADPAEAQLIIINSCGFIEKAKQESINTVLEYRKTYPDKKIVLAGCLAQGYARELSEALPEADLIFGNRDLAKITQAAVLALASPETGASGRVLVPAAMPETESAPSGKRPLLSLPGSAYIKIAEGCNNRCAFCGIPRIRGPLRSRTLSQVMDECRELLDRGIKELCLIGQDLGSYGTDRTGGRSELPQLLEALSRLEGRFWVRMLYLHPDRFPRSILEIIRRDPRVLPYFDLPFQHGASPILRAMNRQGTGESYLTLIHHIRETLPDATIRSTFLTGFPGETEKDFKALLQFQDQARLDWVGCFTYSREEHTPAYTMKPRIPRGIAAARRKLIETRQIPITEKRLDRFVGRTLEALVEAPAPGEPDENKKVYLARLMCQAPEVDGLTLIRSDTRLLPGTLVQGSIVARQGFDLELCLEG
ncbi:MAG: 30S ribosomal protein S12 methylthiotransferase RimO [Treponema sp.]|jgi:ribosomal protein S12 methylthiotransferase|nr:30S ribosomal protein S12 methylthiotransferase RimO [Treponema sp.]